MVVAGVVAGVVVVVVVVVVVDYSNVAAGVAIVDVFFSIKVYFLFRMKGSGTFTCCSLSFLPILGYPSS